LEQLGSASCASMMRSLVATASVAVAD